MVTECWQSFIQAWKSMAHMTCKAYWRQNKWQFKWTASCQKQFKTIPYNCDHCAKHMQNTFDTKMCQEGLREGLVRLKLQLWVCSVNVEVILMRHLAFELHWDFMHLSIALKQTFKSRGFSLLSSLRYRLYLQSSTCAKFLRNWQFNEMVMLFHITLQTWWKRCLVGASVQ